MALNLPGEELRKTKIGLKIVGILVSIRNGHFPSSARSVNAGENVMGIGGR